MIFEGALSVKAIMINQRRKIDYIMIDETKKDRNTTFIKQKAKDLKITLKLVKREEIDKLASGKTHGGIICEASERKYQDLNDCKGNYFCLLEGIEDPFNLGYCMRTLYSSGCNGLLLRKRDWSNVDSVILKSSAGAYENLNVILVDDAASALQQLKKRKFKIYGALRKEAIEYYDADFKTPIVLCVGGEMRGLSASVEQQIEQNIYIPYANGFRNSLNASSAVAALAFEIVRQRRR